VKLVSEMGGIFAYTQAGAVNGAELFLLTFAFYSPMVGGGKREDSWGSAMAEGVLLPPRAPKDVGEGSALPREPEGLPYPPPTEGGASPTLTTTTPALQHKPWRLPQHGLAVFHGAGNVARLSHYFLPRLLLEGKRVLFLDGANSADPRLLERFARERHVPFERFNRGIQIARAFTCFQLTELIARVPKFLADFPAQVVIVTAFPDLYFDEDVRDWNARVAFEQGLRDLSSVAAVYDRRFFKIDKPALIERRYSLRQPVAIAVFSAIQDFAPPPARQRFFLQLCAVANEVWRFSPGADNRLRLTCMQHALKRLSH
jgi:hypothetical protein